MADAVRPANKKKRKKRKHAKKNKNEGLNKRAKRDDEEGIEIVTIDELDEPQDSGARRLFPDRHAGRDKDISRKATRGSDHSDDRGSSSRRASGDRQGRSRNEGEHSRGGSNKNQRSDQPLRNESSRYKSDQNRNADRYDAPAVFKASLRVFQSAVASTVENQSNQSYRRPHMDQQGVPRNSNFQQNVQEYSPPINQSYYPMNGPMNQSNDGYPNIHSYVAYPASSAPQYPIPNAGTSFSGSYYGFENHDAFRLENDYRALQQENQRLKMALVNVISEPGDIKPEVQVTFKHEELAERFRLRIESFIEDLFLKEGFAIKDLFLAKPLFRTNDTSADESYCNSSVPLYDVDSTVSVDLDNTSDAENKFSIRNTSCFNCSGNHFLNECPEVICRQRIAENRAERLATTALQNVRYHKNENAKESFKPGDISDDLRNALNLDRDQVPLYIYHMRVLGYPPGWLVEAAVKSSGLSMYGLEDDPADESQNQNQQTESRIQYDCDKLIDYPGFNVPLPSNFVDESAKLGLPPFQQSQSRSLMESSVEKSVVRPKRRKELEARSYQKPTTPIHAVEDMEVVDECSDDYFAEEIKISKLDFTPPLPAEDESSLPPLPSSPLPPPPPTTPPPDSPPPLLSSVSVEFAERLEDASLSSINSAREAVQSVVMLDSNNVEITENNASSSSGTVIGDDILASCTTVSPELKEYTDSNSLSSCPCPTSPDRNEELAELSLKIPFKTGKELHSVDRPFRDSPSLDELEEKKRLLILALTNAVEEDDAEIKSFSSPEEHNAESSETTFSVTINESFQIQESANSSRRSSESASSFLGSPVVPAFTTFRRLPNFEKFGEGIQDHLPYENIPNSTGTYEQMKVVLREVKEKMARFKE